MEGIRRACRLCDSSLSTIRASQRRRSPGDGAPFFSSLWNQKSRPVLSKPRRRTASARPSGSGLRVHILWRQVGLSLCRRLGFGTRRSPTASLAGNVVSGQTVLCHQRLDFLNDACDFACTDFRQLSFECFLFWRRVLCMWPLSLRSLGVIRYPTLFIEILATFVPPFFSALPTTSFESFPQFFAKGTIPQVWDGRALKSHALASKCSPFCIPAQQVHQSTLQSGL